MNPQLARVLRSGLALFICARSLTGIINETEISMPVRLCFAETDVL